MLKHYQYTEWTEDTAPANSAAVIDLIGVLQKAQHQNGGGPIVLHDRSDSSLLLSLTPSLSELKLYIHIFSLFSPGSTPIGRAGTFCVLSSVLEQLKVEGVVNIFFFVHALRQQQPGLVATFVSPLSNNLPCKFLSWSLNFFSVNRSSTSSAIPLSWSFSSPLNSTPILTDQHSIFHHHLYNFFIKSVIFYHLTFCIHTYDIRTSVRSP